MIPSPTKSAPKEQSPDVPWKEKIYQWADTPPPSGFPPMRWLHTLLRIVLITLREQETNRLSLRSGALTYALLLSMVPMLAMSTALVKGLGGGNELREVVYRYIDTLEHSSSAMQVELGLEPAEKKISQEGEQQADPTTPIEPATDQGEGTPTQAVEKTPGSLTDLLRAAVDKIFNYVDKTNFATLGTFGMLGIFLSVILVLGQIETAMNTIWHVENGRSVLRKISDYLTLMVLMPISINVAIAAGTIIENESMALQIDRFIPAAWIQALLFQGVPILFLSLTIYIIYVFFPNTKIKKIPTMIGALLAGFFWFATQNIYISMQVGVAKYNAIYGSFASIPLFLAWVYLGWLFVLLGAQVAFAIQNSSHYQLKDKMVAPAMQLSCALDLCGLVSSRFSMQEGTTLTDCAEAYPFYEFDMLEKTRDILVGADILHHSEESGEIMPSLPPETLTNHRIIETVLGSGPPSTDGGRITTKVVEAALRVFPPQQSGAATIVQEEKEESAQSAPGGL